MQSQSPVLLCLWCLVGAIGAEPSKPVPLPPPITDFVDEKCLETSLEMRLTGSEIAARVANVLPEVPEFSTEIAAAFVDAPVDPSTFVLVMMYLKDKWLMSPTSPVDKDLPLVNRKGSIPASAISEASRAKMIEVDVVDVARSLFADDSCLVGATEFVVDAVERARSGFAEIPLRKREANADVGPSTAASPPAARPETEL